MLQYQKIHFGFDVVLLPFRSYVSRTSSASENLFRYRPEAGGTLLRDSNMLASRGYGEPGARLIKIKVFVKTLHNF